MASSHFSLYPCAFTLVPDNSQPGPRHCQLINQQVFAQTPVLDAMGTEEEAGSWEDKNTHENRADNTKQKLKVAWMISVSPNQFPGRV